MSLTWQQRNRDKVNAAHRVWRKENPEKSRAAQARYKKRNPDKIRKRSKIDGRRRYDSNPEKERARSAEYRASNPERLRALKLRRFGLTIDSYEILLSAQLGVCAICNKPNREVRRGKPSRMAVDHNHVTGAVRGLLCGPCNKALGLFLDDPALLRAAAAYLERHAPKLKLVSK